MIAEAEAKKNAAIGKPCDGPLRTYNDLKNCNPRYQEALEDWEESLNIDQETGDLERLIELRSEKFEELKRIIDNYNKSAKDIINGARPRSNWAGSSGSSGRVVLGEKRVSVGAGKQTTTRIKIKRPARKVLGFVRKMNKALPTLSLPVNVSLKLKTTLRRDGKPKPKPKKTRRVVPYAVSP